MKKLYESKLDILDTEIAIKQLKDYFEDQLALDLNLVRVSAPLFVDPKTGLNDNLNGVERPITFDTIDGQELQIVQSLAKWKRYALKRYNLKDKSGLYTDMNAIRRDEIVDHIHSYYVDQWDWERIIKKEERTLNKFKEIVDIIYNVLKNTDIFIVSKYPTLKHKLPDKIFYISSQELEDQYPKLTPKERENEICKQYKAVCVTQIGKILKSGTIHDGRSPDYDDWELNGDILVYNEVLNSAFELSSMGIRVDKEALLRQLEISKNNDRLKLDYHKMIVNETLPYTIGGGIGQSRLCMFFLEKKHIGEVQSSIWPKNIIEECKDNNINLL